VALTAGVNHVTLISDDGDGLATCYTGVFEGSVRWDARNDGVATVMIELGSSFGLHVFEFVDDNPHARASGAWSAGGSVLRHEFEEQDVRTVPRDPLLHGVQQLAQPPREPRGVIARRPLVRGETAVVAGEHDGLQAE
jgi:hypothetical protein